MGVLSKLMEVTPINNTFMKFLQKCLSFINRIIPKSDRIISIYGRRMLNDNSAALLDYLISERYNECYYIKVCVSKNVNCNKYNNIKNIEIVTNPIQTIWTVIRSMRVFHSQGMSACAVIPCRGQIIFDLWHGSPLKSIGLACGNNWVPQFDSFFLCASPFMANINKKCFGLSNSQIFIGSNPRNDQMICPKDNSYLKTIIGHNKLIVFMPTFRKSKELGRLDSKTDFPLLDSQNIKKLDNLLDDKNIKLIIKPHPYQEEIPLFSISSRNIIILKNSDLTEYDLTLYQMLGHTDALLTDYSSVYFDYLLLDKPIGFVIEDIAEYRNNRGFTVENPMKIMPGKKIQDFDDLVNFIDEIANDKDDYREERNKVNKLCNTYQTADASRRILDFTGICK